MLCMTGSENLAVLRPRYGYVVASRNAQHIAEVFDLRNLLEDRRAYLVTLQGTSKDVSGNWSFSESRPRNRLPAPRRREQT
jgi:hypothetical protein